MLCLTRFWVILKPPTKKKKEDPVKFFSGRAMFLAVLILFLVGILQSRAQDSAALAEQLKKSAELTSLDLQDSKPWHLKLEVQKLDESGKPGELGTVEEWWASPTLYRVVYTTPSQTTTELRNADGLFRSAGGGTDYAQLELMRQQVVHPMPSEQEMKTGKLEQKTESLGTMKLDCVMVGEEIRGVAHPPLGLFPMYCMEPGDPTLRVTFNFGGLVVARNKMGKFMNKIVPIEAAASLKGKTMADAKVVALQMVALTAADFKAKDDLKQVSDHPAKVASGVIAGSKIGGAEPVYPVSAKQHRLSGSVVMHALIGWDGRVRQLNLVSYTEGDFAISALAAVRTWTYKPYILNGNPTDVDTTITANYYFGRDR
jgi:Gram-negative bacterial TonB protein C-terminal